MTDPAPEKLLRSLETIYENESLSAQYLPGDGTELVVTFGGIGRNFAVPPPAEFIGTAHQAGRNHVLALVDLQRTWFSQPSVLRGINKAFLRTRARVAPTRIHGIGNSMGGYGAILYAHQMQFATTIAFAPQFSMNPAVVREPRWPEFRRGLGARLRHSLAEPLRHVPGRLWVIHGALGIDIRHYTLFPKTPNMQHAIVPGGLHDVAGGLKSRQLLMPFVTKALAGDVDGARAVLAPVRPDWRDTGTPEELDEVLRKRSEYLAQRRAMMDARQRRRARHA